MAKITLYAPKMVANLDDRTISGLLLPFNEVGFTNLGKLTASAESRLDVAETVIFNVEHEATKPIGTALTLTRAEDGIRASFKVLETQAGNDALVEANAGVRSSLSVEIEPVVVKGGRIVSGTITGAGLVAKPAFPSAKLNAAEADPVPDTEDPADAEPPQPIVKVDGEEMANVESVTIQDPVDASTPAVVEITTKTPEETPTDKGTENMAASATVTNAALIAAESKPTDKNALFAALAGANASGSDANYKLQAALSDIVPGDVFDINQPASVGELWSGKAYERRIAPLYNHADLTGLKFTGWKWTTKPEVADYAGDKAAVPSNEPETEPVEVSAYRLAGAHDIDRALVDFPNPKFWESYYKAMTESTAKKSDLKVRDLVRDNATRVHLLNAAMTSGVPTALNLIVKGVIKVMDDLDGTMPDHALVTTDLWEPLMYTKEQDVLTYLNAALSLREGTLESGGFKIVPVKTGSLTVDLATDFVGKVLVGCKDAATVHELGGGAPIRVEAPNVSQGGVDAGVFYYGAVNIHEPKGLVLYDAPTAS